MAEDVRWTRLFVVPKVLKLIAPIVLNQRVDSGLELFKMGHGLRLRSVPDHHGLVAHLDAALTVLSSRSVLSQVVHEQQVIALGQLAGVAYLYTIGFSYFLVALLDPAFRLIGHFGPLQSL
jgi:hypothetical protein